MAVAARQPLSSGLRRRMARKVEYRRILVPLSEDAGLERAMTAACRLAADRGATVTSMAVIEVPPELPLDAHMTEEEGHAKRLLAEAEAIGDLHDVSVAPKIVRARGAGPAIVEEASSAGIEIIVLRAARRKRPRRHAPLFGRTASFVLQNAPCRVMISAEPV